MLMYDNVKHLVKESRIESMRHLKDRYIFISCQERVEGWGVLQHLPFDYNYTQKSQYTTTIHMVEFAWLLADLLNFVYNLGWLVFLTHKHYGQVTTTAGHIFELNVQLNNTISVFIWLVLVDLDALNTWCIEVCTY